MCVCVSFLFCYIVFVYFCKFVRRTETVSVCVSLTSDSSETVEVIIVKLGMVTASDMRIHQFIQGHTDLNREIIHVYFRNYSSNAHQVYCEDSRTKDLYDHCQSDDLDLHSRSQVHLKFDYLLTWNISDNIFKPLHSNLA